MSAPGNQTASLPDRQHCLLTTNLHLLAQASSLIARINDKAYREPPHANLPHRVGAHMRHIIEFYECFLDGLDSSHVDYDARKRDESVETNRRAALKKIRSIVQQLEKASHRGDSIIWVRMEDASDNLGDPFLTSSLGRELQVLASHTVHHFALIALILQAHGVNVAADFGVAPSTVSYHAQALSRAAEAA